MERRSNWHTQGLLRDVSPESQEAAERDAAVRRIALFLHESVRHVQGNLPNALLTVLCRIPEGTPLRRSQDLTLLADVDRLFDEVQDDDPRRPRLKYLLEAASWRSRLTSRPA